MSSERPSPSTPVTAEAATVTTREGLRQWAIGTRSELKQLLIAPPAALHNIDDMFNNAWLTLSRLSLLTLPATESRGYIYNITDALLGRLHGSLHHDVLGLLDHIIDSDGISLLPPDPNPNDPDAPFAAPFDAHRWASVAGVAEPGSMIQQVQPTPTESPVTLIKLPPDPPTADGPPGWSELGEAKQTILVALSRSRERLQGAGVAEAAGYKPGSLRHHYGKLQTWGYIDKAKEGYGITPLGKAIVPCKPL